MWRQEGGRILTVCTSQPQNPSPELEGHWHGLAIFFIFLSFSVPSVDPGILPRCLNLHSLIEFSATSYKFSLIMLSNTVATSHKWLLSAWNVASSTKDHKILILVYFNNS